jgi:hypothetical protein
MILGIRSFSSSAASKNVERVSQLANSGATSGSNANTQLHLLLFVELNSLHGCFFSAKNNWKTVAQRISVLYSDVQIGSSACP